MEDKSTELVPERGDPARNARKQKKTRVMFPEQMPMCSNVALPFSRAASTVPERLLPLSS